MKYVNYVAIMNGNNHIRYVTKIDNKTRTALWEDGETAKVFTKTIAEDLVYGLTCNGYFAVIVRAPEYLKVINHYGEVQQ